MSEAIITVDHLHKDFKLPHQKAGSIKNVFTNIFSIGNRTFEIQHALKDIDFKINEGEFFGIVGRNGSGKSTLLKILAGIYQPSQGSVAVNGRVVPFIELGVGFNGELTGRENVYLNGALMGFSEKEIDAKYQDIVDFSELERFMDQKLKNYSSGMQVRLAFSVATRLSESDILLIDEVLAVGDADFQRKCFKYFRQLKKEKKTVVFVTHDMNAVREYCDRAILIEKSVLVKAGNPGEIATAYAKMFNKDSQAGEDPANTTRWGNKNMTYESVEVTPKSVKGEDAGVTLKLAVKVNHTLTDPIFGFSIRNSSNVTVFGNNTKIKRQVVGKKQAGDIVKLEWKLPNIFEDGEYFVTVTAVHADGLTTCDWWEDARSFRVFREDRTPYIVNPDVKVTVS